jgi:hypothetical protein
MLQKSESSKEEPFEDMDLLTFVFPSYQKCVTIIVAAKI